VKYLPYKDAPSIATTADSKKYDVLSFFLFLLNAAQCIIKLNVLFIVANPPPPGQAFLSDCHPDVVCLAVCADER
jgi:hypothetical protein